MCERAQMVHSLRASIPRDHLIAKLAMYVRTHAEKKRTRRDTTNPLHPGYTDALGVPLHKAGSPHARILVIPNMALSCSFGAPEEESFRRLRAEKC